MFFYFIEKMLCIEYSASFVQKRSGVTNIITKLVIGFEHPVDQTGLPQMNKYCNKLTHIRISSHKVFGSISCVLLMFMYVIIVTVVILTGM